MGKAVVQLSTSAMVILFVAFFGHQTKVQCRDSDRQEVTRELSRRQAFDPNLPKGQITIAGITNINSLPVPPQKRCTPVLDLQSYIGGSTPHLSPPASSKLLSFSVGDIDTPITPTSGSINSAIKLLSSFGESFNDESGEGSEGPVENVVKFRDNRLQIQGLNLSMLNVHLYADGDPNFRIGVVIKNTTMTGRFSYNGALVLANSKLTGFYRMSIDNVYIISSSNLTKQRTQTEFSKLDGTISSTNPQQFNLRTNDFKMNISDLGYISIDIYDSPDSTRPTSNYLLRMLQRVLQKTIKRTYYTFEHYIRDALEREGRRFLDCELSRFSPLLQGDTKINNYSSSSLSSSSGQSDLARIISNEIVRSQLDSISLPDFEHQQSLFGTTAKVQFYNGSLSGLDHLTLNNETRVKLQNEHLFLNTSVGWSNLRPYYNWSLLMGSNAKVPMSKGFVAFNIKEIDFDAVITKGLEPYTRISVDQLIIKRLDSPKMDISGLPGMNRVTRGMVNFFMGRLKQRLVSSIQPALSQQLERSLNKMSVFT